MYMKKKRESLKESVYVSQVNRRRLLLLLVLLLLRISMLGYWLLEVPTAQQVSLTCVVLSLSTRGVFFFFLRLRPYTHTVQFLPLTNTSTMHYVPSRST